MQFLKAVGMYMMRLILEHLPVNVMFQWQVPGQYSINYNITSHRHMQQVVARLPLILWQSRKNKQGVWSSWRYCQDIYKWAV